MYPKRPPKVSQNSSKNDPRSLQTSIKKRSQKITRKIIEFGSQNDPKMKPKSEEKLLMVAPREHPKPLSKYSFYFLSFLELFCLPLGSLWPPFWLHLAAFGFPFRRLLAPFGFLWASLGLSLACLLYTSPSPRDAHESRMPSSA